MSAIGPGDWVECLTPSPDTNACVEGGLYCVEALVPAFGGCPVCDDDMPEGMIFAGHPREPAWGGYLKSWCPCRFRPIYRPKSDFIEQLKQPAPDIVREFEDA